ncbi:hypothetical protein D3C81_931480 [compost metagenome]
MAGEVEALELVHFAVGQWFVRCAGQQPGQLVAADLLRQSQGTEFFLQVYRLAEGVQAEDQRRVFWLPVLRAMAAAGQAGGQLVAVAEQVGVDAAGVDFEEALEPGRGVGVLLSGALLEVGGAHQAVDVECIAAGKFGEAALGEQAHGDHLLDAIACVYVTQAEQRVMEVAAFDQRSAHGIAPYRDVLCQALERLYAGGRWHAVLVAAHLATGESERAH